MFCLKLFMTLSFNQLKLIYFSKMNFEEYSKSSSKKKKEYTDFSNAKKNIADSNKSEVEAKEISRSFYRKPNFYIVLFSALIPSILGVVAFYGTNASKFFDNKVKEVKIEKRELQLQIDSLNRVRQRFIKDSLFLSEDYRQKVESRLFDLKKDKEDDSIHKLKLQISNNKLNVQLSEINSVEKSSKDLKSELAQAINDLKSKNSEINLVKSQFNYQQKEYQLSLSDLKKTRNMLRENMFYQTCIKSIINYMDCDNVLKLSFDKISQKVCHSLDKKAILEIIKKEKLFFVLEDSEGSKRVLGVKDLKSLIILRDKYFD